MADLRICFVSAPGTSAFTHELLEVVAQAVSEAGAEASTHVGPFPALAEPCAYVVVPHEFFLNTPERLRPTPEQRARTVAFCVEHPGTTSFEISAFHAASLGAVMDISDDSTAALRRRGLAAERFRLGYSERFDAWGGAMTTSRPVDITYMGTTDPRRDAILARQAHQLHEWDCRLFIPPHEWMTRSRPDFLLGREKLEHLARSKVLINLHRGESRALEWVRALEAISNGCVIVSEYSREFEPLIPGEHILFGRPENMAALATTLLRTPERLSAMSRAAYEMCRALDMHPSAARLIGLARALVSGAAFAARARDESPSVTPRPPVLTAVSVPQPAADLPKLASWAIPLAAPIRFMHAMSLSASATRTDPPRVETHQYSENPRVHVVIPVPDGRDGGVGRSVRSVISQLSDGAWSIARWDGVREDHVTPSAPCRAVLLNALVGALSAEYVLVLDPGQELYPQSIASLVKALEANPSTSATFGMMADTASGQLWNALPLEPDRLVRRAYLGAPFMVRQTVPAHIGAFAEDPALSGYEYHDFWCRLVESGGTAVLLPQIVGAGPVPHPPELSIARIAPELTWAALRRAAPRLLGERTEAGVT
jgi:Glycosyl transferases group 1